MDKKFRLEVALQKAQEEVRRGVQTDGGEFLKVFKRGSERLLTADL